MHSKIESFFKLFIYATLSTTSCMLFGMQALAQETGRITVQIDDYNEKRDFETIKEIIKPDREMLGLESDEDLKNLFSERGPQFGYIIKVARYNDGQKMQTVGFIHYTPTGDPDQSFLPASPNCGHILLTAVTTSLRDHHIGHQLLQYAIADMEKKGVTTMTLFVERCNERGIYLYRKLGFTRDYGPFNNGIHLMRSHQSPEITKNANKSNVRRFLFSKLLPAACIVGSIAGMIYLGQRVGIIQNLFSYTTKCLARFWRPRSFFA